MATTFQVQKIDKKCEQLEVRTSSLASNVATATVDLDARHEMLLDVTLGESNGWRTSLPPKYHHHHLLLHHPLHLLQLQHPV